MVTMVGVLTVVVVISGIGVTIYGIKVWRGNKNMKKDKMNQLPQQMGMNQMQQQPQGGYQQPYQQPYPQQPYNPYQQPYPPQQQPPQQPPQQPFQQQPIYPHHQSFPPQETSQPQMLQGRGDRPYTNHGGFNYNLNVAVQPPEMILSDEEQQKINDTIMKIIEKNMRQIEKDLKKSRLVGVAKIV